MREQDVFIVANRSLCAVIDQIGDDQWEMVIPDWFPKGRAQGEVTLRTIVNYHAYDDAWVPDVLAGRTKDQVGDRYDGDLLGDDPKAGFREGADRAIAAVAALDDPERVVHLSYGDFPAREYLKHVITFRGFRVHDIAKLIGVDDTLPPELLDGLIEMVVPEVDQWRAVGVFGPAITPPEGADRQTELLCLVGRQP